MFFFPMPKIKKAIECGDHRTISLISHVAKVLLIIIESRITPILEMKERFIEKKRKRKCICFIVYIKVFDGIIHEKFIHIMQKVNIPSQEVRIILTYTGNKL